jgi:phenylacetate-coenzyme A ligase PaaK-like adenylate-forming protein
VRGLVFDLVGRLPVSLAAPVGALHRRANRKLWRDTDRWTAFIEQSEGWSEEQLDAWQLDRLKEVVRHAYAHVPYYRHSFGGAGIEPGDVRRLDDVRLLPMLDRNDLRDHRDTLVADDVEASQRFYSTTGGSTGIPVGFYHDVGQVARDWAFRRLLWMRVGYRQGDRSVFLRGTVIPGDRLWQLDPFWSNLVMSAYHLTDDRLPVYLERMRAFRPRFLQAYPSTATILARYMIAHGEPPIDGLVAALCGSENLYDWQRTIIEDALGCRVYGWYGHSEAVCLAGECEHSTRLHIYPQYGITELVDHDSQPVTQPGRPGEIVATGLHSRAMPLIRYRTTDVAVWADGTCTECGRPYRQFERIEGRLQEFIVSASGRLISMTAVNMHSPVFDNVRQFRFAQDTKGFVVLRLVPAPAFDLERDGTQIRKELAPKLGSDMRLELELVEEIQRSRSGKFHFVDQKLPLDVGDLA